MSESMDNRGLIPFGYARIIRGPRCGEIVPLGEIMGETETPYLELSPDSVERVPFDSIRYQDPSKLAEAINKIGLYGHHQELVEQITDGGPELDRLHEKYDHYVFNVEFARRSKAQRALDDGFAAFLEATGYVGQEGAEIPDHLIFAWFDLFDHFHDKEGKSKKEIRHAYRDALMEYANSHAADIGTLVLPEIIAIPEPVEHDINMTDETQPEINSFQPPPKVAEQIEARHAEYERRWEELDDAGMPQAAKVETLWREFPEFKPAEVIEREELIKVARARHSSPPQPKSKRRGSRDWVLDDAGPRVREEMDRVEGKSEIDPNTSGEEQLTIE